MVDVPQLGASARLCGGKIVYRGGDGVDGFEDGVIIEDGQSGEILASVI
jgi:hypothetical protein